MYFRSVSFFAATVVCFQSFHLHAQSSGDSEPNACVYGLMSVPNNADTDVIHNDPYRWLEAASSDRTKWIQAQTDRTREFFNEIPDEADLWKNRLFPYYSDSQVLSVRKLAGDYMIKLIDQGLNKATEVVLFKGKNQVRVLFSTFDVNKSGAVGLTKIWVSPTQKHVVVPVVKAGSLDESDYHVIEIDTGKTSEILHRVTDYGITWVSPTEFIYGRYVNRDRTYYVHKLGTSVNEDFRRTLTDNEFNSAEGSIYVRVSDSKTKIRFLDQVGEGELNFKVQRILQVTKNALFVQRKARDGWPEVVRINIDRTPSGGLALGQFSALSVPNGMLERILESKGHIFLSYRLGTKRWAVLLDNIGEVRRQIELPDYATLTGVHAMRGDRFKMNFHTEVNDGEKFVYNLRDGAFEKTAEEMEDKLLTDDDGIRYVHSYADAKSEDGTMIPVRVIHRQDLKRNRNNPAYVRGYGGFDIIAYWDPSYNFEIQQFMKDGGVYAAPALRGGSELGPKWHEAAKFKDGDKKKTFEDMAATLKMLTKERYSKPDRIAIEGWSNGGYLIGAMITQYPDLFALGIPGNGVQDQLRKQVLDPRFDGWAYEYGNPDTDSKAFKALAEISPVARATEDQDYPYVLAIVGEDDSRVNAAHTYKLVAALQDHQQGEAPVLMLAVQDSGHWVGKYSLEDMRAYRTNWKKWAMIYHVLEMEFEG